MKALFSPPRGLLARVRWTFLLISIVIAGLAIPPVVVAPATPAPYEAAALISLLLLCASWINRYRRRGASLLWNMPEGLALFLIGISAVDPFAVLGVVYNGLIFRSLYGSTREVAFALVTYLGAFLFAVPLSLAATIHPPIDVLPHVIGLTLVAVMMHILAATLAKHERALARERTLREAGAALAAAPDKEGIYAAAVGAILNLTGGAPNSRVALATGSAEEMVVVASAGYRAEEINGSRLDIAALPVPLRSRLLEGRPVEADEGAAADLRKAMSIEPDPRSFLMIPLLIKEQPRGVIILSSDKTLCQETADGVEALGFQVALALEGATLAEDVFRRKSEERFRSLIQNVSDIIMIMRADGAVDYVSPAVERVLGYKPEDIVGTDSFAVVHPDDLLRVRGLITDAQSKPGFTFSMEVRLRHADGSWRDVETHYTSMLHDRAVSGVLINSRDITERKQAEEELRRSEHELADAQRLAHLGSWEAEPAKPGKRRSEHTMHWSDEMYRIFGFTPQEFTPTFGTLIEATHPQDRERVGKAVRESASRGETSFTVEHRILRPDGEVRYVQARLEMVYDDSGELFRTFGTVLDITERKRAEEELRKSEERFRLLAENAQDVIFRYRLLPTRGFEYVSPSVTAMVGYTPEEHYADAYLGYKVVHPDDRHLLEDYLHPSALSGMPLTLRWIHKDGRVIRVEQRNKPIYDEAGQLVAIEGIGRDITQRKQREEELERQATLLDLTQDTIVVRDREGRISFWNRGAEQTYGWSREEAMGRSSHEMLKTRFPAPLQEIEAELFREGRWEGELVHTRRDGTHLVVASRWALRRDARGEPAEILELNNDITERKRAEEALRRSEQNLAAAQRIARVGSWEYDFDTNEEHWSDETYRILGLAPQQFVPVPRRTFLEFIHPDDREFLERSAREALHNREEDYTEYRIVRADGEVRYVQHYRQLIHDRSGKPIKIIGTIQDVTERKRAEEELRRSERELAEAQRMAHVGNWSFDVTKDEGHWSDEMYRIFGFAPQEFVVTYKSFLRLVHPEDQRLLRRAAREALRRDNNHYSLDYRLIRPNGEVRFLYSQYEVVRDAKGRPIRLVGISQDVTERERAEQELRRSEERFRSLVQNSLDVVTVVDADGVFQYLSPSIETVMGYKPEEFIGTNALQTVPIHPDDLSHVRESFAYLVENPGVDYAMEMRMRHADGSWRVIDATANNLLDDPSVEGIVTNYRDITERKAFEKQLEHQAFHDDLTGLPNRALLMDRLGQALARIERDNKLLAVLFLDLDNFKVINDSLGHTVGDELLVAAARRLQECLRPADTLARLSGDEFILLVEDITEKGEATRLAERIVGQLQRPFRVADRDVHVTTSIGIAYGTSGDDDPDDLLRNADIAMYTAKSRGKAHHKVFDPDMEAEAHERLLLEGGLRRALERGEFRLHYEPTVVLETGEVMGFEALIRWEHPERGLIRPAEFVPLAEENGLIVPMGKWVIEEVCRQAREWHKERPMGPPIVVSVNLSARQFKHPLLVQEISEALQRSGLDPSALTLEITETVMMESGEGLIRRLEELKSLGVMLAIDDFGTGYSSLSYLARFPLDYLKVDRSFIAGLDKSERNVVLVSAVINLAKTLGLRVVAEGVETESQLLILRSLDCGLGQGYLFARPRPADAISPSLLRAGPPNGRAP